MDKMDKMLIIAKEHVRSSRTDQADTRTRGANLTMNGRIPHNQVAAGYKRSDGEGDERRNNEYHRKDNSRWDMSKYFDPSAEDILHGHCCIHYAYLDGKRVFNHLMRDCRTFVKLQEAMKLSQGAKLGSTALMSTHASVLVDSVGPPSAEVCRAAASFP
jgi:hypothetical protein